MPKLQVVYASTRDGRSGEPVARWFVEKAERHGGFEVDYVDLRTQNLPLFDEPEHPSKQAYHHEHTKAWSARVAAADAFVFVTPEYNYGVPPALVNALDYLHKEWGYKAAGFVSYGGASGGLRSVQMAKQIVTTLRMMPIPEGVSLPFFAKQIKDGTFDPGDAQDGAVKTMLDQLVRWNGALATLRG